MSFILDALKKSESDRQRQSGPSLFEVKVAPPRRALPLWAVAIAVLLGINVVVISWMLLRRPAAQQPAAASPQPGAPAVPVHEASAPHAAVTPPIQGSATSGQAPGATPAPRLAATPPAQAAGSSQAPAATPLASRAGVDAGQPSSGDPSDNAPAVEPAATPGFGTSGGSSSGDLPLYQQIVTSDGLPALHLDLHVFADRPQDRFVMINMHRLGEGDTLPGGVHVDAIRPDGVVLTYQGTQFLLPRN